MLPPSKDLVELFFMGPGLLCFPLILFALIPPIRRAWKRRKARPAIPAGTPQEKLDAYTTAANAALVAGDLRAAGESAKRVVEILENETGLSPHSAGRAHLVVGKVLGRGGDDRGALRHLRAALAAEPDDTASRSIISFNLSMVHRRLDMTEEALALAQEAVRVDREMLRTEPDRSPDLSPDVSPRIAAACTGWTRVALALALADTLQDGREAGLEAVRLFRQTENGEEPELADGLAHAYYARAYALKAEGDPRAIEPAREAKRRFDELLQQKGAMYQRQAAEAEALLAELSR
jgi:tetratricopeptide (TPR) repeat protein